MKIIRTLIVELKSMTILGMVLLLSSCVDQGLPLDQSQGIAGSGEQISLSNTETVVIGNQMWMLKNLEVTTFRNGDVIPRAETVSEWASATKNETPAWCYYNNNPKNGEKYGKLYNWYAVHDPRGLAPSGWHVPSDEEWTTLSTSLGGNKVAGKEMKNTSGWGNNGNGTNASDFTGLPGGYRNTAGTFKGVGNRSFLGSSSEASETAAWYRSCSATMTFWALPSTVRGSGCPYDVFRISNNHLSV